MADGEVRIDTQIDTSGLDAGLKDLKTKLNNLGAESAKETAKEKELNKALEKTETDSTKAATAVDKSTKKYKNFGDAVKGIKDKIKDFNVSGVAAVAAVTAVAAGVKKTIDALNECAAAYRTQVNAEEALAVAAKNNPYLTTESVYNLKNFASELQSLSEVGDEVSLQVMSQLAATGRNEEQIMDIMSAAADMAAVTGQDIGSAAEQLNATLNGNAGALGRQVTSINSLTAAELKNGDAIKLVAEQYKGAAKATADTEVQLSNAWGDFKENIGRGWQNVTQPVKEFFLNVLNNINEATAKTNELKDANAARNSGTNNASQTKVLLNNAQEELDAAIKTRDEIAAILKDQKKLEEAYTESMGAMDKEYYKKTYQDSAAQVTALRTKVEELRIEYSKLSTAEKEAADAAAAEKAANEKAAKAAEREQSAAEYIEANKKALQDNIDLIELKATMDGKAVDAGELYNAYLQSYIDLITKSNGLVTENNTAAKERLALLEEQAKKAQAAADAETAKAEAEKLKSETEKLAGEVDGSGNSYIDKYNTRNDELAALQQEVNDNEILSAEEKDTALRAIDEAYVENKKELWKNLTADINSYTQQTTDIAKQAGDLMLENVKSESELELAELDEKYANGEVSEEEYYEEQKKIKRKAAQEEYKIQMFQWTASILAATANIAEGVSKAIAQGGTAGLITGALVSAAGAVQIASIIASKPTPPQFYAGGIIGGATGASMGGDNTYIHARTGEMVLNANQQRSLWDKINGQSGGQNGGLNLVVNNTQAGRVDTDIRQENGDLYIDIIDRHINKGLSDGTFDAGMAAMNTRQEGVRIL